MNFKKKKINFEEIAKENFIRWNEALQTRNPQKVVDLYLETATFLPTVSSDFKKGKQGAREYFEHFLTKNPEGEIKNSKVQVLGDKIYLHSGMYDFEVDNNENEKERKLVKARFSFIWEIEETSGDWKIIHHHSSIKPA